METAAEQMEVDLQLAKDDATRELLKKRIEGWVSRAARYESEPKLDKKGNNMGEGRKELMARALSAEKKRDVAMAKYDGRAGIYGRDGRLLAASEAIWISVDPPG